MQWTRASVFYVIILGCVSIKKLGTSPRDRVVLRLGRCRFGKGKKMR